MADLTLPSPSLSLRTYIGVLRRRRRLIVLVVLITTALAVTPQLLADPVYQSTARVHIGSLAEQEIFQPDEAQANRVLLQVSNEIFLLQSTNIQAEVMNRMPGAVFTGPIVIPIGFSEMVDISVRADDPAVAAAAANAFADVFVADRKQRSVESIVAQADELRAKAAESADEIARLSDELDDPEIGASRSVALQTRLNVLVTQQQDFESRAERFSVDAAFRGNATRIVDPAGIQSSPLSPNPVRAALIGLGIGVLLGLALAVVVDTLQDKVGSEEELESIDPNVPVLTTVPHADVEAGTVIEDQSVLEAFRYLKTGVQLYGLDHDNRSIIVTSAVGNEGKSTTAALLAKEMSDAADRVVLIDCDLRRPTVHEHFGIENDVGLTSLVLDQASITDAIHFVEDNLAVIPAGPAVSNPTELIGSKRFAQVIKEIVAQSDITILDSPPVLPVADTLIAGQLVDASILVARVGEVRRRSLRQLLTRLDEADIPVIGFVANDLPRRSYYSDSQGYYSYYDPTRPMVDAATEG